MIINNDHIMDVAVFPDEAYPPLVIDANAVLAAPISGKLFQVVSGRHSEFFQHDNRIEYVQTTQGLPGDGGKTAIPAGHE